MVYQQCKTEGSPATSRLRAGLRVMLAGAGQAYSLLPNPNNGEFKLWQKVADNDPVAISVSSIIGQELMRTNASFKDQYAHIKLVDLPSGIYYLNLQNSKGQSFVFKFVKL
ncbi:MAG: T9SS type A sorting domain-containing protein [Chitinophagaceae bacterium]